MSQRYIDQRQSQQIAQLQRQAMGGGPRPGVMMRPRSSGSQYGKFNRTGGGYGASREKSMTEIKGVDTFLLDTPLSMDPAPVYLTDIASGAASYQRIGRRINLKSVHCRLEFTMAAAADADGPIYYRAFLVYDKQANGTAFNIADFLAATPKTGVNLVAANLRTILPMNLDGRDRYEIIMDKMGSLSQVAVTGGEASSPNVVPGQDSDLIIEEFRKLKRREVQYKFDALNEGGANVQSGALVFFVVASSPGGFNYTANLRLRYYDN